MSKARLHPTLKVVPQLRLRNSVTMAFHMAIAHKRISRHAERMFRMKHFAHRSTILRSNHIEAVLIFET